MTAEFWSAADRLAGSSRIVIDRPRGSCHPRYPGIVYPLDYGYLEDTRSTDGGGIDLWRGSQADPQVDGLICTVDLLKRDSEIKLLLGCTDAEKKMILAFHNDSNSMKAILINRELR